MKGNRNIILLLLAISGVDLYGQSIDTEKASNPVSMQSRAVLDMETYFFHNEAQFYALRLGFYYGLRNERHLLGMSLPFVHTVFKADYAGFENTSGFGDLKMSYLFAPLIKKDPFGLTRVTLSMDVSVPTGEYRLGRGAGVWVYKPGIIFTYTLGPGLSFYPEVRFQFSGNDANSRGGIDGIPDPDNPEKDSRLQNLSLAVPMVVQLVDWSGWFALNGLYTRSLSEQTNFFFVRMDIGKSLGTQSFASLRISKFVAGQPRLNVIVQANLLFFIQ